MPTPAPNYEAYEFAAFIALLVALVSNGERSIGAAICFAAMVWDMSREDGR